MQKTACLIALGLAACGTATVASTLNFKTEWPQTRPAGAVPPVLIATTNCGGGHQLDAFNLLIDEYFGSSRLSSNANVQLSIEPTNNNNLCSVVENTGDVNDQFYCEQSVWEALPYASSMAAKKSIHQFSVTNQKGSDDAQTFFSVHPDLKGKVVVLRVIPLSAATIFGTCIQEGELHSSKNLMGISLDKVKSPELHAFRQDWIDYLQSGRKRSRTEILVFADDLMRKHYKLFE